MSRTRWRWLGGLALAAAFASGFVLWPAALGGTASYVSTRGTSMQPRVHQGDLVIVREAGSYGLGDVVAFRSAKLNGTTVLHRIVDRDDQGFITQGDNNDHLDPERPTADTIIGKEWAHIPNGGIVFAKLKFSLPLLAAGLVFVGGTKVHARRRAGRPAHLEAKVAPPPSPARAWRNATIGLTATAGACLALGGLSFARPASQDTSRPVDYTQRATFTYGAGTTPGPVYADGEVRTGDPVFRRLVDRLDVTFDYGIDAPETKTLAGTIAVKTEIRSSNGWHRVLDTLPATAFRGDSARRTVRLDLARLESMVAEVEAITGVKTGSTTVSIRPEAEVVGTIGSQRIDETFAPTLDFALDPLQLRLVDPEEQLASEEAGTLEHTTTGARTIGAYGVDVPVQTVRLVSVGLGLPAVLGAGAGALALRRRLQDEADRIELRHGHRMVPVSAATTRNVIEVGNMEDLARLAEQYGSLILHRQSQRGHDYLLQADGVVYRYRSGDAREPRRLNV